MEKNGKKLRFLTESALIAAAYVVATLALAPFSYGPVQVRVAEALTLLPLLTPSAVPGIAVGCLIANAVGMAMGQTLPVDILFGTAASLLAALVTRLMRDKITIKGISVVGVLSPVLFNAVIVGAELTMFFGAGTFLYCAGFVGLGELISVVLLGIPLTLALRRTKIFENGERKE